MHISVPEFMHDMLGIASTVPFCLTTSETRPMNTCAEVFPRQYNYTPGLEPRLSSLETQLGNPTTRSLSCRPNRQLDRVIS